MEHKVIMHLRSVYSKIFAIRIHPSPPHETNKEIIQGIISEKILSGKPFMFGRIGRIEGDVCENIKNTFHEKRSNLKFIMWRGQPNFLNPFLLPLFKKNAGFFPINDLRALEKYYDLMINCMHEVDILASCCDNEFSFQKELINSVKVNHELSTPLLTDKPWTLALKGKKVLVIHPFAETIKSQYERIDKVFPNTIILPKFHLDTIKAIQTSGGGQSKYKDWFEALDYMKSEIDKCDFDTALIGCGAYGFPLAAYCKKIGKQALQLGGITQLLFGIKGSRWETDPDYINVFPYIPTYQNEYWVRPSKVETPTNSKDVENNCYW